MATTGVESTAGCGVAGLAVTIVVVAATLRAGDDVAVGAGDAVTTATTATDFGLDECFGVTFGDDAGSGEADGDDVGVVVLDAFVRNARVLGRMRGVASAVGETIGVGSKAGGGVGFVIATALEPC